MKGIDKGYTVDLCKQCKKENLKNKIKQNNLYEYLFENNKKLIDMYEGDNSYLKTITVGNTSLFT